MQITFFSLSKKRLGIYAHPLISLRRERVDAIEHVGVVHVALHGAAGGGAGCVGVKTAQTHNQTYHHILQHRLTDTRDTRICFLIFLICKKEMRMI